QRINVTRGVGNIAPLKHRALSNWPSALSSEEFRNARERLTAQVSEVIGRMRNGGEIDPATLRQPTSDVEALQTLLRSKAGDLSIEPFIEAKRYLQGLSDSLVALR